MLDNVRLYDRALTRDEVLAHYRGEAATHDFDPAWFQRVKITPYYYLDDGYAIVEADYSAMRPLEGAGRVEATLVNVKDEAKPIRQVAVQLPEEPKTSSSSYVSDLVASRSACRARGWPPAPTRSASC